MAEARLSLEPVDHFFGSPPFEGGVPEGWSGCLLNNREM